MTGYTEREEDAIILSSFTCLSYEAKRRLSENYEIASPDFKKHESFLIKTLADGVYNIVKANFASRGYREKVFNELDSKGIECVTYFSDKYPQILKNIYDPPLTLYCKGDTSLLNGNCFAVVGSRKTPPAALAMCKKLSGELTAAFTVVTGLAEGADSAAIEGALAAGGKVISVLANGFDTIYPATNLQLFRRVCNSGLAITEYPPEVLPKPYRFPVRNRIIAGLSKGTLVVSAGEKSGALITADLAADYGRDVFAFPYSVWEQAGKGCNKLIKNGAYLAENILDIFGQFGLDCNTQKQIALSFDEEQALNAVKQAGEAFLTQIAQKLNKPPYKLISVLSSLEIKGLVVRLGGNRYAAV